MNPFTFKTEETFLMIKSGGKLRHIKTQVSYSYEFEQDAPDFEYGSKEENDAEMERFRSGELLNLCLIVKASALGEEGFDYLGQVFVSSFESEKQLLETAIEHDMKNNACKELRSNILAKFKAMNEALVGA